MKRKLKVIREEMEKYRVWDLVTDMRKYTIEEFINEFGNILSQTLKDLLKENIIIIQKVIIMDKKVLVRIDWENPKD